MPEFSTRSMDRLKTCHQDLQTVFHYTVQTMDCMVVYGHRTQEEQFELYKKGRELVGDAWVVTEKSKIVTYLDGYIKKSKHNEMPSLAVDVIPYPEMWTSVTKFRQFGNYVKGVIDMLYKYGTIENVIEWGGDWKWKDYAHWQIKKL